MLVWTIDAYSRTYAKNSVTIEPIDIQKLLTYEPKKLDPFPKGNPEPVPVVAKPKQIAYKPPVTVTQGNETVVWNFLISQGFSRSQTAGIMGNLQQEHNFQTSGDGLAQWMGGRKARLMAMPDPYNINTQLNFLMIELNGSYVGVKNAILSTNDVATATRIFQNQFERCGVCAESQRINYAFAILNRH